MIQYENSEGPVQVVIDTDADLGLLTLTMLWANSADENRYFSYFSLEIGVDISCIFLIFARK